MEILLVILFILGVTILPVYLYSRSRLLTLAVFGCHAVFLAIYRNFLFGNTGVWHDTFFHTQIWFSLIDHWIATGTRIEWLPYLGAGMPMAIFSNFFLWSPLFILSKLFHLAGFKFTQPVFFNLIWLSLFFGFTAGLVLLTQELFRRKWITILVLSCILFGGLFACELAEGLIILAFAVLPYLFFFLLRFYRSGRKGYLFFFSLLYGISVNQYLPTYNFLVLFVVFGACLLFYSKRIIPRMKLAFSRIKISFLIFCALTFLAAASPAIYSYFEMRDYVSPARGLTSQGVVSRRELAKSVPVDAPPESYLKLFDTKEMNREVISTHRPFYIGIVLPILFLYGLFLTGSRPLALSGAVIFIFALGFSTPLWPALVNLPFIKMTRQVFGFSRVVVLIFILISCYGLKGIFNRGLKITPKILFVLAATVLMLLSGKIGSTASVVIISLASSILVVIALLASKKDRIGVRLAAGLLIMVCIADFSLYSWRQAGILRESRQAHILPMDYPVNWVSTCDKYGSWLHYDSVISGLPFELRPIIRKLIVWSYPDPAYVFMLQKDFARFVYGTGMPDKPGVRGSMYFLLDRQTVDALKPTDYYPLKLANFPLEFFAGVKVSSSMRVEENGLSAIDLNPLTYWHINLKDRDKAPAWIELSYPFNVQVDAVRIIPRYQRPEQFWRGRGADLQTSLDAKVWTDVIHLPGSDTNNDSSAKVYRLPSPLSTQHLRLKIEDQNFLSLAEFQVIDSNRIIAVEQARNAGDVSTYQSNNPNRQVLDVDAQKDSYLLRLENFHRGWRVLIDGRRGVVKRIPPNFQMIPISKGKHRVILEFHSVYPELLSIHLLLAVAGWFGFIIFLARKQKA